MSVSKENITIGFIGTGVMGKSMVGHLLKAGYNVVVYNRTKSSTDDLIQIGAVWQDTIAKLAEKSNVIISMVGYPKDVEEVYLGENGILKNAKSGSYLVDMTTSSPDLAKRIYSEALDLGMYSLDAPVSGGDIGAKEARLAIMVGGEEAAFNEMLPIFNCLGKNIVLQGNAGAGQYTKMCNQIAIASNMMGVCEAMAYAQKAGLKPEVVLRSIETGAAASFSLSNLAPRMLANNFAPGFYVKHFIKDMKIALDSAKKMGLHTPSLELAMTLYEKLAERGEENSGTQALFKLYLEQEI